MPTSQPHKRNPLFDEKKDLAGLDDLGTEHAQGQPLEPQDFDLSGLDRLGGELARGATTPKMLGPVASQPAPVAPEELEPPQPAPRSPQHAEATAPPERPHNAPAMPVAIREIAQGPSIDLEGAPPALRANAARGVPSNQPNLIINLLTVGGKWLSALATLRHTLPRRRRVLRQRSASSAMPGVWSRVQLAGAHVVRAIAVWRARAIHAEQARRREQTSGKPLSPLTPERPPALPWSNPRQDPGANTEELVAKWLKAADRARRRGNLAEAKELLQLVLDRDPRNEAAWEMSLLLSAHAPALPPSELEPITEMEMGPAGRVPVALLVVLPLLVLVGAVSYVAWLQLPGLFGGAASQNSAPASTPSATLVPTSPPGQLFPETGFQVAEPFLGFWNTHSGAQLFGNPISPPINEPGANGENLTMQYFERARFELRPGSTGAQSDVALGKLGLEVPASGTVANPLPEGLQGEQVNFKETGISVPKKFSDFWESNGGAAIFGNPIAPVLIDTTPDGKQLAVQYFERVRFEYHPEQAGTGGEVALTNLGTQIYRARYPGK